MRLAWQVALVVAAAVVALAVPATRPAALVGGNWLAAVLMVVAIVRRRPDRRRPWALAVAFVALIAVANTGTLLAGHQTLVTVLGTTGGELCAAAALPALLRDGSHRPRSVGTVLDMTILVAVTGFFALELLLVGIRAGDEGSWVIRYTPVLDVVLIGVLLWLVLTRARLVPALTLILVGAFGALTYDLLCTANGQRGAELDSPVAALGVVNMLMFALGALHPSMTLLGTPDGAPSVRRPSVQLLLVLPVAVLPVVLLTLDASRAIDLGVAATVVLVVVVLAFLRAVLALRDTEASAARDPLTGLLNRSGLTHAHARMRRAPGAAAAPQWLLMVDLDDFKEVNDRFGHGTGDRLLLTVADRLRDVVGASGVVARHGGDEFIVLVDAPEHPDLDDLGQAVVAAVQAPSLLAGRPVEVAVSVGAVQVDPAQGLESQLGDADIALYRAKQQRGSAVVRFVPEMRDERRTQVAMVGELRALLQPAGDPGVRVEQLVVLYQPIVDLRTGAVTGAEALVRWQHPERGRLAPDAFLDLVEREGLGPALDAHVLGQALGELRGWNAGRVEPLTMSVNLGLGSMCDPALATWVRAALDRADVPAAWLRLEITEHDQLPDDEAIAERLHDVVALGCGLSLDDFGVGYTSLSYLQRFPVTLLKLDRTVVTGAHAGTELLTGIAAMSASLSLDLLAEGVETGEQRDRVHRLGVDYAQGYHFARPLPPAEFGRVVGAGARTPRDVAATVPGA